MKKILLFTILATVVLLVAGCSRPCAHSDTLVISKGKQTATVTINKTATMEVKYGKPGSMSMDEDGHGYTYSVTINNNGMDDTIEIIRY
ncbi:MAG: hypothetical protein O2857_13525 [Planctomycetota bacterium]|nr:hypothetical protein [Planctomycetota bacterium]